jgi:glycosyltransferase involved in cell wall biosynthesis
MLLAYGTMKIPTKNNWVFFAIDSKPTSMRWAIAERLAENEPIVIVGRPVSILRDYRTSSLRARCQRIAGLEACWNYRPLHYPERLPIFGRIMKLVNRHRLQRELNKLLPNNIKRIVCYDSPTQDHLVGKLSEEISVYLAIDDKTLTVCGEPIHGELEDEKRLLSKVYKVVCVSESLAKVLNSRVPNGRTLPIQVLPNGYDERIFNPNLNWHEPGALRGISRPRILVAGHISERIDWDGIIGASHPQPRWTWIFVGPADNGMRERIASTLGQYGFYHPSILLQDVPGWIYHCDACAVPYRLNPFTCASDPLKAIEYLAMGAPVLSTRIPSLKRYSEAIEWVNEGDGESYALALDTFANPSRNKELGPFRQQAVAGDSWGARVGQFKEIIFNARP